MKNNTWIAVTLLLALTGSIVAAKSFMSAPEAAQAKPTPRVLLRLTEAPPVAPQPPAVAVVESLPVEPLVPVAPRVVVPRPVVVAAPPQPSPQPEVVPLPQPQAEPQPTGWTVVVVKGDTVEEITYTTADVKAPLP